MILAPPCQAPSTSSPSRISSNSDLLSATLTRSTSLLRRSASGIAGEPTAVTAMMTATLAGVAHLLVLLAVVTKSSPRRRRISRLSA